MALVAVAAFAVVVGSAAVGAAGHSSKPVTAAVTGGIIGAAAALALLAYRKRRGRRRRWELAVELALSFGTAVWVDVLTRSELVFVETLLSGFVAVGAFGSARRIRNRAGLPDHGIADGSQDAE